ncbi:hypothetical protein LEMLEM_LOCUS27327 [Lemmus lemmus]
MLRWGLCVSSPVFSCRVHTCGCPVPMARHLVGLVHPKSPESSPYSWLAVCYKNPRIFPLGSRD